MTLALVQQHERDRVRVRICVCDCGDPKCDERMIAAQPVDSLEDLWVAVAVCDPDEVDAQVELLLDDEPLGERTVADVLEHALPLVGLPWGLLTRGPAVVVEQMTAWCKVPEWMERVPLDTLWSVRACTFGPDVTRVPRALWALHRYYAPDSPARGVWS